MITNFEHLVYTHAVVEILFWCSVSFATICRRFPVSPRVLACLFPERFLMLFQRPVTRVKRGIIPHIGIYIN